MAALNEPESAGGGKHKVISVRDLSPSAYVLRLDRRTLVFDAGQYIHVGPLPGLDRREYSVYSSPDADYLEILVKEIPVGAVSPRLRRLEAGEDVDVEGPFGFFRIEPAQARHPLLFIATGTGISPFHCFVQSRDDLNYRLVHGVRGPEEAYDHGDFSPERLTRCYSRSEEGDLHGRVTDWLRGADIPAGTMAYLCGNCDMIYEAYDILGERGIPADRIHAEVYF